MKFFLNKILLFNLILIFNIINCQLQRQPIFKCEHNDYEEKHPLPTNEIKKNESYKRRIEGEGETTPEFVDFKIHLDFANLEKDLEKHGLLKKKDFFEDSMKKAVDTLTTLLKVKPLKANYNIKDQDFHKINITAWDKEKFGDAAIAKNITFQDLKIHLAIFGTLTNLSESTLATASAKVFQTGDGQPLVGVVKINNKINYTIPNSDVYFESILVHEFTHILGFSQHFFKEYSKNLFTKEDKFKQFNNERYYLKGPKLLEVAKKYFNCDSIEGVELENQGGSGTAGSHWEARILLGEYMNGYAYTEEQVISEFTLAVLEDSGYYKPNYYTGGLMRFGKHKGCEFLEEKCVNSSHQINSNFENEFYDTISSGHVIESSCSSGRQSRTYNAWWTQPGLPKQFQYFENENITGYEPADFCPVPLKFQSEEDISYFAGHCSIKGSGEYGSMLRYAQNFSPKSEHLKEYTGETFSDRSYCYLSSVSKNDIANKVVRANCYETFCSDKSLTVKIFRDYVVCPRAGGKVKVEGYGGYLLCPDYNLICSGSVVCNNIFDCVEKKSLVKEESYNYNYVIKTSQNIERAEKEEAEINKNYELSENGPCPIYCKHCLDKKVCLECMEGKFKVMEKDESVKCYDEVNEEEGYHVNEKNVYIKCIDNCTVCEDLKTCKECKDDLIYKNKQCMAIPNDIKPIENCNQYSDNFKQCLKCKIGYAFNQTDKTICHNIEEKFQNYYSKDNDITFYPCSTINENCTKCYFEEKELRAKCTECKDDLVILNKGNGKCLTKEEIIDNPKYYLIDETHAGVCSKDIENCMSCDNVTYCTQCKLSYVFDSDLNQCVNKSYYEEAEAAAKEDAKEDGKEPNSQKENNDPQSKRRKVKKKKNGSNYFSISNIIMFEIIYVIFLLIKF